MRVTTRGARVLCIVEITLLFTREPLTTFWFPGARGRLPPLRCRPSRDRPSKLHRFGAARSHGHVLVGRVGGGHGLLVHRIGIGPSASPGLLGREPRVGHVLVGRVGRGNGFGFDGFAAAAARGLGLDGEPTAITAKAAARASWWRSSCRLDVRGSCLDRGFLLGETLNHGSPPVRRIDDVPGRAQVAGGARQPSWAGSASQGVEQRRKQRIDRPFRIETPRKESARHAPDSDLSFLGRHRLRGLCSLILRRGLQRGRGDDDPRRRSHATRRPGTTTTFSNTAGARRRRWRNWSPAIHTASNGPRNWPVASKSRACAASTSSVFIDEAQMKAPRSVEARGGCCTTWAPSRNL